MEVNFVALYKTLPISTNLIFHIPTQIQNNNDNNVGLCYIEY